MKILEEELGWEYYGGKHYESVFTRFFQAYILPVVWHRQAQGPPLDHDPLRPDRERRHSGTRRPAPKSACARTSNSCSRSFS
jgi:hypothetical protein